MSWAEEWYEVRLKNLFVSVRNGIWGDDPEGDTGVFCARGTDFDRVTNRICEYKMPRRSMAPDALRHHQLLSGDLVIEKSGGSADQPVGSVALFDLSAPTVCSNFNARMRVSDLADPRFVCYLMNGLYWSGFTRQFVKQTTGIQNLDTEALLAQRCTLPPLNEQRRIANFLDVEMARIECLSSAISQSVSLLQAKRRTLLRSIFPDRKCVTGRLGYYLDLVTSGPRGWGEYVGSKGTPFFRSANLRRNGIEPNLDVLALVEPPPSATAEALRSRVRIGDVLIGITGANTGWVSFADQRIDRANVSQHVCLVRPGEMVEGQWLAYALSAPQVQELLLGSQYGGTKTQLSLGDIRDLVVPLPAKDEQRSIMADIAAGLTAIATESAVRHRQLEVLVEHRQALITAAVTGQMDVTTARGLSSSGGGTV